MLQPEDFERAASKLECPVAHVKAVCEVESNGGGFDVGGRPRILFEAHKFSRLTGNVYDRTNPKISSNTWNSSLYATGANADVRNGKEHDRLAEAVALNRNAALMSASWGLFQILGENFGACGYDDLQSFINDMHESEGKQLDAFVGFVRDDRRRLKAIQVGDWATFARLYNGASYAKNKYDVKLAAAARKYA